MTRDTEAGRRRTWKEADERERRFSARGSSLQASGSERGGSLPVPLPSLGEGCQPWCSGWSGEEEEDRNYLIWSLLSPCGL